VMRRIVPWLTVIAWALLIFVFSHQPARISNEASSAAAQIVADAVQNGDGDVSAQQGSGSLRRFAQGMLYLVLGVLLVHSLSYPGNVRVWHMLIALFACLLYTFSDEFHRMPVPGREAEWADVVFDAGGAVLGIALYMMLSRFIDRRRGARQPS